MKEGNLRFKSISTPSVVGKGSYCSSPSNCCFREGEMDEIMWRISNKHIWIFE